MTFDAPNDLRSLIEAELAELSDARVLAYVRGLLVEPRVELRDWDYGSPGQQYPCWIVLEDAPTDTAVAYCESGFGPKAPWGLFGLNGEPGQPKPSMGMDSAWMTSFLDVFFDSMAATKLPIWRVQVHGASVFVSDEMSWQDAWRERDRLQAENPATAYGVGHGIRCR